MAAHKDAELNQATSGKAAKELNLLVISMRRLV
jgi:hypothetical protein